MRFALIGAGALGARHLQSLVRLNAQPGFDVGSVTIVDPSPQALDNARLLAAEAAGDGVRPELLFSTAPDALDGFYDLAVIATNAGPRMAALEALLAQSRVGTLILEKFLFQTRPEYDRAARLLAEGSVAAFVHTPRSAWNGYEEVRRALGTDIGPAVVEVSASRLNLLSNAIHFMDLLRMLTRQKAGEISVRWLSLAGEVRPSKRPGVMEADGSILVSTARGDQMMVASFEKPGLPLQVRVSTDAGRAEVDEGARRLQIMSGAGTSESRPFEMNLCSEMAPIWGQLLRGGRCGLPDYGSAAQMHLAWMQAIEGLFQEGPLPIT